MQSSAVEAVGRLVASVEEALAVFDLQHQERGAVKHRSGATLEYFQQMRADSLAGNQPNPALYEKLLAQRRAQTEQRQANDVKENFQASCRLTLRWETAFCDMLEALMQLHAFPEWRDDAAGIAAQIREIRLLQVEKADEFPAFAPTTPKAVDQTAAGQPETRGPATLVGVSEFNMFKYAQTFMAKMEDHHHEVQKVYARKLALTRSHLVTTLAAAQALAQAIQGQ